MIQKSLLSIKPTKPLKGWIDMYIGAYFETPKSWSKKKQREYEGTYRAKVPDLDNVEKILLDAMNGYIFEDDKQVVSVTKEKKYSSNPRTELIIMEIE